MTATMSSARKRHTVRDYLNPRVLVTLALGFSSGLPFLLVGNTFGFWLADEGTSLTAIGFISWVGLAYSLKFLWAPLLDRLDVPVLGRLGRRRGWMALAQIIVGLGLVAMAINGLSHGLVQLGALALVVAFAAATQDIAIDAWRIEIARNADELGLLTSALTLGFRIALLCTDSLILVSAQHLGLSKDVIGAVRGTLGLASVFAGVALGGFLSVRFGYMKALLAGGVLQAMGIAAFALLTVTGADITAFTAVMCFDDVAISIAGVTLVAYMSSLTSLGYTATQYALLSSAYALAGKFLKGFSGLAIDSMAGHMSRMHAYGLFFIGCGLIGIPSLLLFWLLEQRRKAAITPA